MEVEGHRTKQDYSRQNDVYKNWEEEDKEALSAVLPLQDTALVWWSTNPRSAGWPSG